MKKLVTLLSVPVVLLVAWGGTSWYVGQQTETSLKQFIEQQNQAVGAKWASNRNWSATKKPLSVRKPSPN